MKVLVTGAAGFIGFHTCLSLAKAGHSVVGIDNLNDYYSPALKQDRLAQLGSYRSFRFIKMDIADTQAVSLLFTKEGFSHVVNLAAQAGVRYSLQNPKAYIQSNIDGFLNILEGCRHTHVSHLVFASSSSVYGLNTQMPFNASQPADHPSSLYAATKKSNELMAHSYSYLYNIPATGLRYFTVYGPWGRPDMAIFIFTKAILEGTPLPLFNSGNMQRDFTYIDDIVEGTVRVLTHVPKPAPTWQSCAPDPSISPAPYAIYNIGNNKPAKLAKVISTLEETLGKQATISHLPMQPGDVQATYADIVPIQHAVGFFPKTGLTAGIHAFVKWYRTYYGQA